MQSLAEKYELHKCFQCGKCTAGCPVSPKSTLNIRRLVREAMLDESSDIVNNLDELWDCTTCQTCTIRCPRGLEPHELIITIRSSRVEKGNIPKTAIDALEGVFKHGNPWGKTRTRRAEWANEIETRDFSRGDKAELLYFVCCAASYDPRIQDVAKAIVQCLSKAGTDFGILGNEETCCGSEVRRMGEEGLFEMLVEDNLKLFHNYGISRIVTTSPHCYDAFKNRYRDNEIQAMHYTQLIAGLIRNGDIAFSGELNKVVTYHDPCYLGKQNAIFEEPRSIIDAIPGITFIEFDRSRERSLCCEGGGGRMWLEASDSEERLAAIRIRDAVDMGADIVATACPFCLLNLEDAVKTTGCEGKVEVKDIAELLIQVI